MKARLYDKYVKEVVPALKEKRKDANVHQVPRMEKIVVNMGVSASLERALSTTLLKTSLITGASQPSVSRAIASPISSYARGSQSVAAVTLRRDAMYEFFDRLVATALPRIRDFRGLSTRSFDGRGNYSARSKLIKRFP